MKICKKSQVSSCQCHIVVAFLLADKLVNLGVEKAHKFFSPLYILYWKEKKKKIQFVSPSLANYCDMLLRKTPLSKVSSPS